jgi:N-methylhydantoinase A
LGTIAVFILVHQMANSETTRYLGVDTGGTFTDFVVIEGNRLRTYKCPSTPEHPERAILHGINALDLQKNVANGSLVVVHGSTVATNAALEGKGVKTVFITNRGFGDMLTIGRQTRPALYDLRPHYQSPPVPPELCLETGGRLNATGETIDPLSQDDIRRLQQQISELQPEAVAINLLFSFLDSSAEDAIASALPDTLFIAKSSRVLPEYKEYERGIATWLNAWLGPKVAGYLGELQRALVNTPLSIMQSSGGTLDAANAAQRAVNLLLSGPAGGLAAARQLGQSLGRTQLMTFDMGGTSSDVALIDRDIKLTSEGRIGPYPVAIPMVDMHTIGAGGGSIAYIDDGGLLRVGPESAGAIPGPACYNKDGQQPTVTDANVVLGRIPADAMLGGDMPLSTTLAQKAIARLAQRLSLSIEDTAQGIIDIANEHMTRALRVISVQRGHNPADFTLCCFGGAGGLHICALAEDLGCKEVIIPNHGGVFSALGMLQAPRERQLSRTLNRPLNTLPAAELTALFTELADQGRQQLLAEGVEADAIRVSPSVDLCYQGQSYTLNLAWQEDGDALHHAFHQAHQSRYGHDLALPVQLINIRQAVRVESPLCALPKISHAYQAARPDWLEVAFCSEPVPRYQRSELCFGQTIQGPALISEAVATSWLSSNWQAQVSEEGHLLLQARPRE